MHAILLKNKSMCTEKMRVIYTTEHRIELKPNTFPVRQMLYQIGEKKRDLVKADVGKMFEDRDIRLLSSEWDSTVVRGQNGDGELRFCVELRRVNVPRARYSYIMPRMEDCIDAVGETKFFTTFNANFGFYKFPCETGIFR